MTSVHTLTNDQVPSDQMFGIKTLAGYTLACDGTEKVAFNNLVPSTRNGIYDIPANETDPYTRSAGYDVGDIWDPMDLIGVRFGIWARTYHRLQNEYAPNIGFETIKFENVSLQHTESDLSSLTHYVDPSDNNILRIALPRKDELMGIHQNPVFELDEFAQIVAIGSTSTGSSYIEGLGLTHVSNTQLQLEVGAAFIPGLNRTISVEDVITATRPAGNSIVFYVYLYETNGEGQLEVSTTPPDIPYFGSAQHKSGDTTKRYLGMLKNDTAGNLLPFECEVLGGSSMLMIYSESSGAFANTSVFGYANTPGSGSQIIGPAATNVQKRLISAQARTVKLFVHAANDGNVAVGRTGRTLFRGAAKGTFSEVEISADDSQQISWARAALATGDYAIAVVGYYERR